MAKAPLIATGRLRPLRLFSTLLRIPLCGSKRSIKRNVKKKVLPRPEGEKICLEIQPTALWECLTTSQEVLLLSCLPFRDFHCPVVTTPIES